MSWSCGRRQCKRTLRAATTSYCRCGTEFCSEACFVSEWHADHHETCPNASEIKEAIETLRRTTQRNGTAVLVGVALSRVPPSPFKSPGGSDVDVSSPVVDRFAAAFAPPGTSTPSRTGLTARADPSPSGSPALITSPPARAADDDTLRSLSTKSGLLDSSTTRLTPSRAGPSDGSTSAPGPKGLNSSSSRPELRRAATAACDGAEDKGSIKRYQLEDFVSLGEPIGSGSYGIVSKVIHKTSGEVFAMKTITKQKVLEHKMTAYLTREVKTQIKAQHPNILRLIYYFEDKSNVFLLLEYAKGGSLFSLMKKKGCLPESEAAGLFVDVASALDHLHRGGVVHRDLKPENILMCDGNVAKLADFGWCAELNQDGGSRHTFCGTWDYLSPEMVSNEPHDFTVDIWALGVLLYEMLTGRPPFAAGSQVKAMNRITKVDLQIPETVSPGARDLIGKLIVKERKQRLSLSSAVRHHWVLAFLPRAAERVGQPAPSPSTATPSPSPSPSPPADPTQAAQGGRGQSPVGTARSLRQPGITALLAGWEQKPDGVPAGWGSQASTAREGRAAQAEDSTSSRTTGRERSAQTENGAQTSRSTSRSGLGNSLAPLEATGPLAGGSRSRSKTDAWRKAEDYLSARERPLQTAGAPPPSAGSGAAKASRLNDFIKKHLDAADTGGPWGAGVSSSISTAASEPLGLGGVVVARSGSKSPLPPPVTEPPAVAPRPQEQQQPPAQQQTPQQQQKPQVHAQEEGGAPVNHARSLSPLAASRKELWNETTTFAAIQKWVRQNQGNQTPLGGDLDSTSPSSALAAGQKDGHDLFNIPITHVDHTVPLPKRRAATVKRRVNGDDKTASSAMQFSTRSASSKDLHSCRDDVHGFDDRVTPRAGGGRADELLVSRAYTTPQQLNALQTASSPPAASPRAIHDVASRMRDLRSQIDRDLDISCLALQKRLDRADDNQPPPWKDELLGAGTAGDLLVQRCQSDMPELLMNRWKLDLPERTPGRVGGLTEASGADKAGILLDEASTADKVSGAATFGRDAVPGTTQDGAVR